MIRSYIHIFTVGLIVIILLVPLTTVQYLNRAEKKSLEVVK